MAQCGGESSLPDRIPLQQARRAKRPKRAPAGPCWYADLGFERLAMRAFESDQPPRLVPYRSDVEAAGERSDVEAAGDRSS